MFCESCWSSTRVFGVCVSCHPKPVCADITDPDLRWFLDVLAEEPEHTLTDEACRLIQMLARKGEWCEDHIRFKQAWEAKKAEAYAASPEAQAVGRYVGEPKERWEGLVRCDRIVPLGEGQYGPRYLLLFTVIDDPPEPEPAVLAWFTGEGGKFDPKAGETYTIRATVKEHKPYNGVRQTLVLRVKDLGAIEDA